LVCPFTITTNEQILSGHLFDAFFDVLRESEATTALFRALTHGWLQLAGDGILPS